jgi:hypothetical protein
MKMPLPPDLTSGEAAGVEGSREAEAAVWRTAGEVLHILRPLVYTVTTRIFGSRSWIPILASATVDAASAVATDHAIALPTADAEASFLSAALGTCREVFDAAVEGRWLDIVRAFVTGAVPRGLSWSGTKSYGGSTSNVRVAAAATLISNAVRVMFAPPRRGLSALETAELRRRKQALVWYLMRGRVFTALTAKAADGAVALVSPLPIVSTLAAFLRDTLQYYAAHHTYTAAT